MKIISILFALASPAWAGAFPDCAHFPSFKEVLDCQAKARNAFEISWEKEHGGNPPSAEQWEKLEDFQRRESRAYLAAHSSAATTNKLKTTTNLGGIKDKDLGRLPADQAQSLGALQERLKAGSDGGKKGVDAKMAQDVTEYLNKEQGDVSPEMQELHKAVSKDGSNLTPETMQKLQDAARQGKGSGLDLNVQPDTEKFLLEHDFKKDPKPASGSAQDPE